MAEPEDRDVCAERRDEMQASMEWIDWATSLKELAEQEGVEIELKAFRKAWKEGKSPEEALEEAEGE